jgi:outer membrane protein assembly factor BamB
MYPQKYSSFQKLISFPRFGILLSVALLVAVSGFNCKREESGTRVSGQAGSDLIEKIGVTRGICVILEDKKCEISLDLLKKSELLFYIQLKNDQDVLEARQIADSAGYYGIRIYVDERKNERINLADNIADVVIAFNKQSASEENEIQRVLRPNGKAILDNNELTKTFPEGVDDWTHPYHSPDNNTQSKDQVIKAPYLTQFLAEPHYGPVMQVTVASNGIVFKGFGNVAFHEREEKFLNTLVAFNGYNGTMLWKRALVPGIMLHRNTMIATPHTLYVGDDKSCKLIDPLSGQLKGEISPDEEIAGGTFWKWMALENEVLYAVIGEQEQKDPVMRWRRQKHGWPWTAISKGFNQKENEWGFGNDILAMDAESGEIIWHHHEDEAMDSRAVCMKNERIYIFRFGTYLACLDAGSGDVIWKKTVQNSPELFEAIGDYLPRQSYDTNWRTRNYLTAGDKALYFAGPQIDKLLAVSSEDGTVLWQDSYNNYQVVVRDDGLYAISGPWGQKVSKKFDPMTGAVLANLPTGRRACTRPSGSSDAIFFRASGGTVRFDLATREPQWISPMRPSCQDGVTIANGLLYWWPYVCDCQLSIYGVTALTSAGNFKFGQEAMLKDRLTRGKIDVNSVEDLISTNSDWPSFRKDNQGRVTTNALVANKGIPRWKYPDMQDYYSATNVLGHPHYTMPTAPVTVDGLVFYGSTDGIVRALDVTSGNLLWKAYTGGAIRIPPTVWKGYLLVGSGDGYVYNFSARTGKLVWKFRAAPEERKIPVYGRLISTWPAASGILVEDGIAYIAAGIINYDGTHVYALDAKTGDIKWQNNSSGHLLAEARTGASVLGHMILDKKNLYLASGTSLSPAIYSLADGQCLNDPEPLKKNESYSPRGWELYQIGDHVVAAGKPYYSNPKQEIYDVTVQNKMLHTSAGTRDILWVNQKKIMCYPPIDKKTLNECTKSPHFTGYIAPIWGNLDLDEDPYWEYNCPGSQAIAVCKNAVVVAENSELVVLNLKNGKKMWSYPLEYPPVPWGLTVSRDGNIVVVLEDGSVNCFGGNPTVPTPYVSSKNNYFVGSAKVSLACDTKGSQIYYTLNGTDPDKNSKRYIMPFELDASTTLKMRAFASGLAPSFTVTEQFRKVEYALAQHPGNVKLGISYDYFIGPFMSVSDLDKKEPVKSGVLDRIGFKEGLGGAEFGYIFKGYILVPEDDIYTFYLESNDGSKLYINNEELIDNDGGHTALEKSAKIALKGGEYPIMVKYFQMGGGKALKLSWESKNIEKKQITAEVLFHK